MKQSVATCVNVEGLRNLLGGEDLRRLVERLCKRMSRGEALAGKIQLCDATASERSAIDKLMGRPPTRGTSLTIDLDKLAEMLIHAKVCDRLEEAVTTLVGPVPNKRSESLSRAEQWDSVWRQAICRVEGQKDLVQWIEHLRAKGLLKRMACGEVHVAETLLDNAISIVEETPFPGIRLAELAASKTGNSHALDRGQPLGALVIQFARQLDEYARWKSAAERRDAWETLGVLCDEVSGPVLVLNLRADGVSLTGQALNLHAAAGEPYRLSVRQLRRHPPEFDPTICGPEVFVCENPTVVDVVANRLGSSSRPLICIDGQPKIASQLLLDALTQAGIQIRYHGDFDWEGIRIGNRVMQRHRAVSWRFNAADYLAASENEYALKGEPVSPQWDAQLGQVMARVGRCVHEENVLVTLLTDLRQEI